MPALTSFSLSLSLSLSLSRALSPPTPPSQDVYTAVRTDSSTGFGTWALAQEIAAKGVDVYNYVFRAAPSDLAEWGAMHLTELAFVLDEPGFFPLDAANPINWTSSDAAMSDTVQQFWVNFAGTGGPNVQAPGAGDACALM